MNGESKVAVRKRRRRAEIERLVAEFTDSGMERSEFCRSRGLGISTLNRHLKTQRRKRNTARAAGRLVAVELTGTRHARENQLICGLIVVLSRGRRIEVQRGFDDQTFARLIHLLEKV